MRCQKGHRNESFTGPDSSFHQQAPQVNCATGTRIANVHAEVFAVRRVFDSRSGRALRREVKCGCHCSDKFLNCFLKKLQQTLGLHWLLWLLLLGIICQVMNGLLPTCSFSPNRSMVPLKIKNRPSISTSLLCLRPLNVGHHRLPAQWLGFFSWEPMSICFSCLKPGAKAGLSPNGASKFFPPGFDQK